MCGKNPHTHFKLPHNVNVLSKLKIKSISLPNYQKLLMFPLKDSKETKMTLNFIKGIFFIGRTLTILSRFGREGGH